MAILTVDDLAASGLDFSGQESKAQTMIDDVEALAFIEAPCLRTTTDPQVIAGARAVLRGAVLRWHEAGTASYQAQAAGPPGIGARPERVNAFYRHEVETLQRLCAGGASASVYSITLAGL